MWPQVQLQRYLKPLYALCITMQPHRQLCVITCCMATSSTSKWMEQAFISKPKKTAVHFHRFLQKLMPIFLTYNIFFNSAMRCMSCIKIIIAIAIREHVYYYDGFLVSMLSFSNFCVCCWDLSALSKIAAITNRPYYESLVLIGEMSNFLLR